MRTRFMLAALAIASALAAGCTADDNERDRPGRVAAEWKSGIVDRGQRTLLVQVPGGEGCKATAQKMDDKISVEARCRAVKDCSEPCDNAEWPKVDLKFDPENRAFIDAKAGERRLVCDAPLAPTDDESCDKQAPTAL